MFHTLATHALYGGPVRATLAAAAAAASLLVSGCTLHVGNANGNRADGRATGADPATVALLRSAVQGFWDDILTGQGPTAYTWISLRCQHIVDVEQFSALVIELGDRYAGPPQQLRTFHGQLDGDHAVVSYTFARHALDESGDHWVRDPDGWHWDSCDQPPHHPDRSGQTAWFRTAVGSIPPGGGLTPRGHLTWARTSSITQRRAWCDPDAV
jgi:hypothetical protein